MRTGGRVARVGGAAFTALTVVAGGVVLGSGTAAGDAIIFGSSTGSAGSTPSWLDEALDGLRPCRTKQSPTDAPDPGPCYLDGNQVQATHGDYLATYNAASEVAPGAEVSFGAVIKAKEAAFDVADPEHTVDVTSVTLQPPQGFEFVRVNVTGYTPWSNQDGLVVQLDSTVVVDPETGSITVNAPDGGWPMWPGMDANRFDGGSVRVGFTFKAPEQAKDSVHGFTFTGTNVPDSRGLVVSKHIRVSADGEGTGSSGS
ncbi:hypothetical protein [Rhodococcus sp. Q]|uniref:hypothetical protein n=1 Tax=Rhodococcus sp. Q TaxID=2502252 RepID=UPI0010F45A3C|nr:hypothetical protein [Rhodococcus sp. Q]